tara:strand:+ start:15 stop:1175 length:1161 start_codon:yes stop_codon:yes gene_type:complete
MNIHEYQAKEILKEFGASVPKGVIVFKVDEIETKIKKLNQKRLVLKAQIHAGGRGKAGGIKIVDNNKNIFNEIKNMLGKSLITPQTGPKGKIVNRIYIEEATEIDKEFYLSCLIDRKTSKILFISSDQGGVDIEKIAIEDPKKIITTKISLNKKITQDNIENITSPFFLNEIQKKEANNLINSLLKIIKERDASLVEINPLILSKNGELICLDAKMNFDDNAIFRQPKVFDMRDLTEEDPKEIEASKHGLSYIKLNGSIGCMVNGAGLAMATLDIIKLYGSEPANFLDVGGGASKEKVSAAFKIILSDKNVKGILINIFGGIMRCDILAQGVVEAVKETNLSVPLVVRLAGTNEKLGKEILKKSNIKIISANNLSDAAKKIIEKTK